MDARDPANDCYTCTEAAVQCRQIPHDLFWLPTYLCNSGGQSATVKGGLITVAGCLSNIGVVVVLRKEKMSLEEVRITVPK